MCIELFTNPKILQCLHTFCDKCLVHTEASRRRLSATQVEAHLKDGEVWCPLCHHVTTSEEGIEGLKSNLSFSNLIAHVRLEEAREASEVNTLSPVKPHAHVYNCIKHNEVLKLFCYTCSQVICLDCTLTQHHNHSFESIAEVIDEDLHVVYSV